MLAKKVRAKKRDKSAIESSFIAIARRLGFLSEEQVPQAAALCEASPEEATDDLLVGAGMITTDQAQQVASERKSVDPLGSLDDTFKKADRAITATIASGERLVTATRKA